MSHASKTLTTLNLSTNAIGSEGVRLLADALQINEVKPLMFSPINQVLSKTFKDTHIAQSLSE